MLNELSDLKKFFRHELFLLITIVISILLPCYLAIYIFSPGQFAALSLGKLTVLSASIAVPGLLINWCFSLHMLAIDDKENLVEKDPLKQTQTYLGIGGILTFIINYFSFSLTYFLKANYELEISSFKLFTYCIAVIELLLLVLTVIFFFANKSKP